MDHARKINVAGSPVAVVGGLDQEGVLVGLAALILLAALRIVVDVLQFIQVGGVVALAGAQPGLLLL